MSYETNSNYRIVSDGSVLKELVWLKSRYPHVELIYEQSMIRSLERVFVEYAMRNYDVVFDLSALSEAGTAGACLRQLFETYHLPYQSVAPSNRENALQTMAEHLITPVMPASYSLAKAARDLNFK
ncbi:MAG: hypothetical protein LBT78_09415 [Tannerella sp.]|nr:hypothetical protein [Tannerella sp.]